MLGNGGLADVKGVCSFGEAELGGNFEKHFVAVAEHGVRRET